MSSYCTPLDEGQIVAVKFGKVIRGGKFRNKIDKKTREIIVLNVESGKSSYFEIKGTGSAVSKWFEAEKNSSGIYELTTKGKRELQAVLKSDSGSGGGDGGGGGGC